MQVLIVDDHPVVHQTLAAVAEAAIPGAEVHIESTLPAALTWARTMSGDSDLVLLDLGLPGCTGLEALTQFRQSYPRLRLAVVSGTEDADSVEEAIARGALGYIPKTSAPPVMVTALKVIASGGRYLPTQIVEAKSTPPPPGKNGSALAELGLTCRQAEVLRMLMKGMCNRDIARQLDISESTVKQHLNSTFRALGVGSRTEAMVALARRGFKLE